LRNMDAQHDLFPPYAICIALGTGKASALNHP
jgi:hypothetical protein